MANTKSAVKSARRSLAQRTVNRRNKSILKKALKEARSTKTQGVDIEKALSAAYSALDKAVYKGILHKNAATRQKQRLVRLLRGQTKTTNLGKDSPGSP
ncbi:MAG: 30S ribosomal protein S20 [Acidobacteria bacterium]|nr:30S ribosomal protein S20 [Acidobacteriota bacterium]